MHALAQRLFDGIEGVRYVAVCLGGEPELNERPGIGSASSAESDRYEELLVNPTILLLARQRGELDCGGLGYVVIRYGNFYQVVIPLSEGHVSIAVETTSDPLSVAGDAQAWADELGLR